MQPIESRHHDVSKQPCVGTGYLEHQHRWCADYYAGDNALGPSDGEETENSCRVYPRLGIRVSCFTSLLHRLGPRSLPTLSVSASDDRVTDEKSENRAVIASCVRIAYVRAMLNNPDVLYTQGSAAVWSAVEINIGILCNCLAMLKPFVRRHMPWLKSLVGSHSNVEDRGYVDSGGKGKTGETSSRRESRKSAGRYELHSYGRDRGFGNGKKGEMGDVMTDTGLGPVSSKDSEDSLQGERVRHKGILVTTTVAMGRSSQGDMSEDDILPRDRSGSFAAITAGERKVGLASLPVAKLAR